MYTNPQLGQRRARTPRATPVTLRGMRTPRVAIIGGGMSGIGMAAKLRLAGIETFHIYEKWDGANFSVP